VPHQESKDELAALRKSFWDDLQPVGVLEEMLVDQIANAYWRLRRVASAGSNNISDLKKIASYEAMLRKQVHQATTHLKRLQQDRRKKAAKATSSAPGISKKPKAKVLNSKLIFWAAVNLPQLKNLEEVTLVPWEED
jgi:hypothetical protein